MPYGKHFTYVDTYISGSLGGGTSLGGFSGTGSGSLAGCTTGLTGISTGIAGFFGLGLQQSPVQVSVSMCFFGSDGSFLGAAFDGCGCS